MTDKPYTQHLYNAIQKETTLVSLFPFLLTDVTKLISTLKAVIHMSTQNLQFKEQLTFSHSVTNADVLL